ncbi:MAG: hypothetical protein VX527_03620 [Planctomycetota bacterium]|nr:hypothetical protein [Planctomycetota bacterium]
MHIAVIPIRSLGILAAPAVAGTEAYVTWGNATWDSLTEQGSVEVRWQSDEQTLAGFQFNISEGSTLLGVEPLECDEGWLLNASENLVLCFAIQPNVYIDPSETDVGLVTLVFEAPYATQLTFVDPIFATPEAQEIDAFVQDIHYVGLPNCPADVYPVGGGDGIVDVNDVLGIIGDWDVFDSPFDVNGDGIVDVSDVLEALNGWGDCD